MQPNGQRRITMPGQIPVDVNVQPGPWASPAVITFSVNGGVKAIVAGGLTREEATAAPIFAHLCAQLSAADDVAEAEFNAILDALADKSLELAERLLAASTRRAAARAAAAQKPSIEGV